MPIQTLLKIVQRKQFPRHFTGYCACVTAEVDYHAPQWWSRAGCLWAAIARTPRLASAVTPPFIAAAAERANAAARLVPKHPEQQPMVRSLLRDGPRDPSWLCCAGVCPGSRARGALGVGAQGVQAGGTLLPAACPACRPRGAGAQAQGVPSLPGARVPHGGIPLPPHGDRDVMRV